MMLESKIDKQIKRYLKKISFEVKPSATNESIHYSIMYDNKKADIRFAQHTSNHSKAFIDIVKITEDLYRINVDRQVHYTVYDVNILSYLKAILLVGPEIFKIIQEYQERCHVVITECNKIKQHCERKLKHYDPEFMDQIWEERDKAVELCESEIKKNLVLEKELQKVKSKYSKANNAMSKLKVIINNWK